MTRKSSKIAELIGDDLPIAVTDLIAAGYASRTTLWRLERGGMPVTRIGRRIFVKFSDLVNASPAILTHLSGQNSSIKSEI